MNKKLLFVAFAGILLSACHTDSLSNEVSSKMSELSSAGELSTTEYTISKIIKANDCDWYTIGDRMILFNCNAYLEAGIDMKEYDATKTVVDENKMSITLVLPKTKLLSVNMPYEETKLVYEKVGVVRASFSAQDRNDLLKQGEADIREGLEEFGVLEDAEQNARTFFIAMLSQMGFKQINIKFE